MSDKAGNPVGLLDLVDIISNTLLPPPRSVAEFRFSDTSVQNVCTSSNPDPQLRTEIWVLSPPDGTENVSYTITTITGPTPESCIFNNTELSVTRPNASNGTFNVAVVSQGKSATLSVNYGTCIASLAIVVVHH